MIVTVEALWLLLNDFDQQISSVHYISDYIQKESDTT